MSETKHSMELRSTGNRFVPLKIKRPKNIKNDLLSGLTVALALVPEAIAFSFVAGSIPKWDFTPRL